MQESESRTVKETPICKTKPLRSRTVDTLLHILSLCYADSTPNSDKDIQIDVSLDSIPNDSLFQEQTPLDETRAVLDTQKDCFHNKQLESGEKKDLSQKVNTNPSVNFNIKGQDNYDMVCSSPHLPTDKDVEDGEISGDFMDFMPEIDTKSIGETDSDPRDKIGTKTELKNDSNIIPLFTEAVENGGADVARVVNKTTRNLVDYSEIVVNANPKESGKQATLKINATKKQDRVYPVKDSGAQNNRKREGSCTEDERRNKKSKKSVDPTTNITLLGENLDNTVQQVVDASTNKGACNEKKRKRVLTKERKAKRKMKDRIKRAETNRKLGIKRLKLVPVIKEKKITYCRHYINGRCHEGDKCKFSHDTIPMTKSMPCCHFARHNCMKGDDCPYDHQLSKYPCNNYQTKGSCNRGSDCMFSHQAQPSEVSLTESKPEQKPPSTSSAKIIETKSCSVLNITPKSTRPPKGITFLSQGKFPPPSPKLDSDLKEITKTPSLIQVSEEKKKMAPVVQESAEVTKTPPVVPRGINFLSFGKKPGLDPFRISSRVDKPVLSDVVINSGSTVNVVNEVKVDFTTDRPSSSRKPIPLMSLMSSASQKALHSTLAFASGLDSGVKSKV